MKKINIGERTVGAGHPVYIIAELSANHNQQYELAVKTIKAAKAGGADAIKLQTYTPDSITLDSDLPYFRTRRDSPWAGQKLYDLYRKAYTPWEWHAPLKALAEELGLDFFSSPFDPAAVDLLEDLEVPVYKVASPEITDIPLIEYIASKGKPVIISTGIATEDDIRLAVATCRQAGNDQVALLKCTTAYPTPLEEVNLRAIPELASRFGVVAGLSDHTMEVAVPVAATALGACIIEKHFILDRSLGGVDSSFSLNKEEFAAMVQEVRKTERALGKADLTPSPRSRKGRRMARSLFAIAPIKAGETLSPENIRSIRPAAGLHPKFFKELLGKRAKVDIAPGTPLAWEILEVGQDEGTPPG